MTTIHLSPMQIERLNLIAIAVSDGQIELTDDLEDGRDLGQRLIELVEYLAAPYVCVGDPVEIAARD
jgi:hypothetical protein